MKVLMVVESHSTKAGGGPIYWSQLSDWLIGHGHEVIILSGIEEGTSFASPNTIGLFPVRTNLRQRSLWTLWSRFFFSLRLYPAVRQFAQNWRPDIIHTVPPIASEAALRAGRALGVPVVASILSHVERQWSRLEPQPFRNVIFRFLEQKALRRPFSRIICLTKHSKQVLIADGVPRDRIIYIPHAVNPEKFNPHVPPLFRTQLALDQEVFVLGYAGSLTRDKGIDQLILALAKLKYEKNVHLLIAGEGPDQVFLERIVSDKGLKNVKFLGSLDFDLMPAFMSSLDLYIVPSYSETLPTSLLEALASGTPVMATRVGGVEDFLKKESGVVLPNAEATTIAASLEFWLNRQDKLKSMAQRGRKQIEREHTWEETSRKTEEVYLQCLHNTRS